MGIKQSTKTNKREGGIRILHVMGSLGRLLPDPDRQAMSGVGNSVLHIAAAQVSQGHNVQVLGFSDPYAPGASTWQGVEITALRRWKWARLATKDVSFLLPMFWQVVRHLPVDILHIHGDLGLLHLLGAQARILHLHNVPSVPLSAYSSLMARAKAVILCSEYARKTFLAASGYPPERTFVVYNGAAPPTTNSESAQIRQQLGLEPDQIGILFVGALVPDKGVHVLMKALRRLKAPSRIKTIIVGGARLWVDGAKSSEYERDLINAANGLNVSFLGLMPHREVERIYGACDVLVLPSVVQEAHPLVICEAMAAGKPVIASKVGGIPETVINGQTGILVPPGDPDALASAIQLLAENRNLREQMGRAAQERARCFSWEASAARLNQIYQMVLSER